MVTRQTIAQTQFGAIALPRLNGSVRQIAWAETIRLQQLAKLHRRSPDAVERAARLDDASWWIKHRSDTADEIATLLGG